MGRNGSGKSSLVKHFNGLLKPTKGEVTVCGVSTRNTTIANLAKEVGYLFQNPNDHLIADTVEEEITFTAKNLNLPDEKVKSRVEDCLLRFNLKSKAKMYPRSLSGGEKQRVALASVVVGEPKVLILDEPTRGMEYDLKRELMTFLNEYRKNGNAIVLVTHDIEIVAEYVDRVILLSEGKIIADGPRREVLSEALLFSPQINRLVKHYEKYGIPRNILTEDELLRVLK